jgi:hypothetical protein
MNKKYGLTIIFALLLCIFVAGCGKSSQKKIVGKWSPSSSGYVVTFMENGEMLTSISGMPDRKEKYRFIDNETLEAETAQGEKVKIKVSFSDNDNTMNTDLDGVKKTYKRQ